MTLPMTAYLAIDAGGTFLKSAVLNSEGEVISGSSYSVKSSSKGSKEEILRAFSDIIAKGLEFISMNNGVLNGTGIAFPGPFNIYDATPLMYHKFQKIYGFNLRQYFRQISGVPANIPIKFIHDANAVLVGEHWKGNAQGYENAAVVTLGTGLGFAISENREVLCNKIGGPFISIFKLPYKDGILENYTARMGFIKIYQEISGKKDIGKIEVSDLAKRASEGDESSLKTFKEVGKILAESIREILIERNIKCLLFSGQISRSFQFMEKSITEELKNIDCLKKIDTVMSIENAAIHGAFQCIFN